MALFGKRKSCPICGQPTPRLLVMKVEDQAICDGCFGKVDLPDGVFGKMTMKAFEQYLQVHDANAPLREKFSANVVFDVAGLVDKIEVDTVHDLFRVHTATLSWVFEGAALKSFRITEDGRTIFEGTPAGMQVFDSEVPGRLQQITPYIEEYRRELREYERMRDMARITPGKEDDEFLRRYPKPRLRAADPVEKFRIILTIDHSYWRNYTGEAKAPDLGTYNPDPHRYLRDYEEDYRKLEALAQGLSQIMGAGAVSRGGAQAAPQAAPQAPQAGVDPVAEIQRYKGLLDAGILTQEEFDAKKRQLLGI